VFEFELEYPGTTYVYSVPLSWRLIILTLSFWASAEATTQTNITSINILRMNPAQRGGVYQFR
jgi:hypothetical protein